MRRIFLLVIFMLSAGISAQEIQWFSLEEAEAELKKSPEKHLFIDFYTDWCGWCKTMDRTTFTDPEVIQSLNDKYIAVKFDAEQKGEASFRGKKYQYVSFQPGGRKGVNSFAYFSLRGRLSYPSYAVLTKDGKLKGMLRGYLPKDRFLQQLNAIE